MRTLVYFEDSKATLFGRSGKDCGQDALSGDGIRVFQAKYHQSESAASAIRDAKDEAEKIEKYRKPEHTSCYLKWKDIKRWRLITNAVFNPTDHQRWKDEIEPLFAKLSLEADYCEQAGLDALLDKYPEVDRAFFRGETRAMLSIPEVLEKIPNAEPFLPRAATSHFYGRKIEMNVLNEFLASDKLFLVIHGAGGVGKTRFMIEAGQSIAEDGSWQVLWANTATMAYSGNWFEAVVPERQTLLLVDEPEDSQILRVFSEQPDGISGRTSKWKVAVSVRTTKDPVLTFLQSTRLERRLQWLPLNLLSESDAREMCTNLLATGTLSNTPEEKRKEVAEILVKRFRGHAVWLTLAIGLLERVGDLSNVLLEANNLADEYVSEMVELSRWGSDQTLDLLRWVALLSPFNREDNTSVRLVVDNTSWENETTVRQSLAELVNRKALKEWGANERFVDVKPDVLRDHLLTNWLTVDVGYGDPPRQPSQTAKDLFEKILSALKTGELDLLSRTILVSLARTERILFLSGQSVHLLEALPKRVKDIIGQATASQCISLAKVLRNIAVFRSSDVVDICRTLRLSRVSTETVKGIFGDRQRTYDHIILELAWTVYHAAAGAGTNDECDALLTELCELAEAEAIIAEKRSQGLPNDGQRATELIRRILQGEPNFRLEYDDAGSRVAKRLLNRIINETTPTTGSKAALESVVNTMTSVEIRRTWFEGNSAHIQMVTITPANNRWLIRQNLTDQMKQALTNESTTLEARKVLWRLLSNAHLSANQHVKSTPEFRKAVIDDLYWAKPVITSITNNVSELTIARKMWEWHLKFEDDKDLKSLGQELEEIYLSNDLAKEFQELLIDDDFNLLGERLAAKAKELAGEDEAPIINFLERATRFLGVPDAIRRLMGVATVLGSLADSHQGIRDFVRSLLGKIDGSASREFAFGVAYSWVWNRRKTNPEAAFQLVKQLLRYCGNDGARVELLHGIYGRIPSPEQLNNISEKEFDDLRAQRKLFFSEGRGPDFVACTAWGVVYEWPSLQGILELALKEIPPTQLSSAFGALVEAIDSIYRIDTSFVLPEGLDEWLLNELLKVPYLDNLDTMAHWHLGEIIKRGNRMTLKWLPTALRKRIELEEQGIGEAVGFSPESRISCYAATIVKADVVKEGVRALIRELLDFQGMQNTVGYHLNEILRDVDPHGLLVSEEVAKRIRAAEDTKSIARIAELAETYADVTAAWRTIAKPVLERAAKSDEADRRSLYRAIAESGVRSWTGTHGEVPEVFISKVKSAKKRLEEETDEAFRPYWEWRLQIAEAELREQEQKAKEERERDE